MKKIDDFAEYDRLLNLEEKLRKAYPKIYTEYRLAGREYRKKYRQFMIQVHTQFAAQPLRDAETESMMEDLPETDRWLKAETNFDLITQELWITRDEIKLLTGKGYEKSKRE